MLGMGGQADMPFLWSALRPPSSAFNEAAAPRGAAEMGVTARAVATRTK
jgi:hypothetical protein